MKQTGKNNKGFTLIETLAVIVLVGIISTVLSLILVQGVKSYVFARANVSLSQKAQAALARMERELTAISDVDPGSDETCIMFKRQTATEFFRTIGLNGSELQMNAPADTDAGCPDADTGDVLIDRVESFSLQYENSQGNLSDTPPENIKDLRAIRIDFSLDRQDRDSTEDFSVFVSPRNTGLLNAPGGR